MTRRFPVLALALLAAFLAYGCGSGTKGAGSGTATGTADAPSATTTTVTPGAGITASGAIRSMDLANSAPVQKLIADTGGQFVPSDVLYGDLTGDGIDEAVVPISSGGTMGNITYTVLSPTANGVVALPLEKGDSATGGVAVAIVGGNLVDTRPEYGPNDPECCPSMLRKTTYAWNGSELAIASAETVTNPNGGVKGTPAAANPTP